MSGRLRPGREMSSRVIKARAYRRPGKINKDGGGAQVGSTRAANGNLLTGGVWRAPASHASLTAPPPGRQSLLTPVSGEAPLSDAATATCPTGESPADRPYVNTERGTIRGLSAGTSRSRSSEQELRGGVVRLPAETKQMVASTDPCVTLTATNCGHIPPLSLSGRNNTCKWPSHTPRPQNAEGEPSLAPPSHMSSHGRVPASIWPDAWREQQTNTRLKTKQWPP